MKPVSNEKKAIRQNRISDRFDGAAFDDSLKNAYSVTLENKTSTTKRFCIFGGLLNTLEEITKIGGVPCDYIATEGQIKNGETVEAVVTAEKLDYVRRFLNANPTACVSLQIQGKDQVQLAQRIFYKRINAFRNFGVSEITPAQFQSSRDSNTSLVNMNVEEMILGDQSLLLVDVAPQNHVVINFFMKQSNDAFELLSKSL